MVKPIITAVVLFVGLCTLVATDCGAAIPSPMTQGVRSAWSADAVQPIRFAARRTTVVAGTRGFAARRTTVVAGARGNAVRRTTVVGVRRGPGAIRRTTVGAGVGAGAIAVVRPVRPWARRAYYGTVVGGIALGTLITVTAVAVAPEAPAPNVCWYWTDESRSQGYWDYCQ
jgi:hypothetical protein